MDTVPLFTSAKMVAGPHHAPGSPWVAAQSGNQANKDKLAPKSRKALMEP